jgi:hypothetical protein
MSASVFVRLEFWLLVVFSFVVPLAIYAALLAKRTVSAKSVLFLGLVFIMIAGVDVFLLQSVASSSRATVSVADDVLFVSEVSLALYLPPALFAGIGINMVSHVLIRHLTEAEERFERESSSPQDPA